LKQLIDQATRERMIAEAEKRIATAEETAEKIRHDLGEVLKSIEAEAEAIAFWRGE